MGKRIIPILLFLLFLLGIYLPGPNGLFALIKRKIENRLLKREIETAAIRNILLRAKLKRVSSPQFWQDLMKEKR